MMPPLTLLELTFRCDMCTTAYQWLD